MTRARPLNSKVSTYQAHISIPNWLLTMMESLLRPMVNRQLSLTPCGTSRLPDPQRGKQYLLYLHIPFCHTLCSYCTFHRFLFKEETAKRYFNALRQEMHMAQALGYDFNSLYIGGGTPTVMENELVQTIELARQLFPNIEQVSCESDPLHLDHTGFKQLEGHVDRMSVGVQSFNDDVLKLINRYEKFGSGKDMYNKLLAAKHWFPIVNVDLMVGLPGQTQAIFQQDLQQVMALEPGQITLYPLMITELTKKSAQHTLTPSMYGMTAPYRQILENLKGPYTQLSAWAFGLADNEGFDEYVIDHDEYVGLGSGAFSFLNDTLYANTFSLKEYQVRVSQGLMSVTLQKHFTSKQVIQYRFLLGLFAGKLSKSYFEKTFGVQLEQAMAKELGLMKLMGAIQLSKDDPDSFVVTDNGRVLASMMMKTFYSGMDKIRNELRKPLKPCE
jgi:coproporphyrinogen III oxidase-like Fe-S oxidoreductase